MPDVIDLFAGPGGWSLACAVLGLDELGIEFDASAVATRTAAGFASVHASVSDLDPADYHPITGFIASPPCQAFSAAGAGAGRDLIPDLAHAIRSRDWTARPDPDPKVWLVLEVGRWIEQLHPEWVALEQVPAVLPLWNEYATWLRSLGYSAWCGILNAADYGVPQTRRRAVLVASRTRIVTAPPATHDQAPQPSLFGELAPWVTMAQALGWHGAVGFPRLADGGEAPEDGYRARDWRSTDEPSFVVTEKARSWILSTGRAWGQRDGGCQTVDPYSAPAPAFTSKSGGQWQIVLSPGLSDSQPNRRTYDPTSEPAPTVAFGHDAARWTWQLVSRRDSDSWIEEHGDRPNRSLDDPAPTITTEAHRWAFDRPATTLMGDLRVFTPSGHTANDGRDNSRMKGRSEDAIRVTPADALVLQSFPPDFPVQGTNTKKFEQIGNAIPPLLALHLLLAVTGMEVPA